MKMDVFKQPKKSTHILATFVTKLDTKTFKKRPIWSHWIDNATNSSRLI